MNVPYVVELVLREKFLFFPPEEEEVVIALLLPLEVLHELEVLAVRETAKIYPISSLLIK